LQHILGLTGRVRRMLRTTQLASRAETKGSYTTYKAAKQAGMAIKKSHPILQVAVYDVMASVNKIIEMPKV
jgi:hypothetical protein